MTTTPDLPGLPGNELDDDGGAAFDELARRAGAALRRPAPEDGVSAIAHRRRRRQALNATVAGGVAVATLIGALLVLSIRDDPDGMHPVDSLPATLPATTTTAPTTIAPGEEISVTADLIQLGDGLVGLLSNMDRADGRTYVIAGRYQSEEDLLFPPEQAVLAAFDDAGTEMWRTELDGTPIAVVADAGDVWVRHEAGMTETLSRLDASNGRVVDQVSFGNLSNMIGAFGSVWVPTGDHTQLIRVDPDLSTTTVELPGPQVNFDDEVPDPQGAAAGPDAIWVPLVEGGVAVINPDTLAVMVIPVDKIGHDVLRVGFDGDVAYVASRNRVTSIVDGEVVATLSPGEIWYLGRVDGAFGALLSTGQFQVLQANDPMVVETRQISLQAQTGGIFEVDGEAWMETGRNHNLGRVEFLPVSEGDG